MSEPDFFPHRVRPLEDSLIGLDRGLRRIGCLLRAAALPCVVYVVIMAIVNQIHASYSLPSYVAFTKSELEWWFAAIVFLPFGAIIAWGMLRCLLSHERDDGLLAFGSVPTSVYGLAAAWMAANWLTAVAVRTMTVQLYSHYLTRDGSESIPWLALHSPRLIEIVLSLIVPAVAIYLVVTAAIAARPSTSRYRSLVAVSAAVLLLLVAVDILQVHGGVLTDQASDGTGGMLSLVVALAAPAVIGVVFLAGSFRFPAAHVMRSGGWRLAVLLLIAAGLANGAVFALDALLRWVNLFDIRIDDPFWRQEFAARALAHHAVISLRDVVFYLVLLSVTAQGFRRVLGAAAADPVAGSDDAIGAERSTAAP